MNKNGEENTDIEFIAYSRLLLRRLLKIRELLANGDNEGALLIINELIEDTETDIK